MIDISSKEIITRRAVAQGKIILRRSTLRRIKEDKIEKGDPFQIASVGAIQAVKSTPSSLMMCHPIPIESANVEFSTGTNSITARISVLAKSKTGVEMEALNGVANALLNIWDVVKKYEKDSNGEYPEARIEGIHVIEKTKGK